MAGEFCQDHTEMVKAVGKIEGTVTMILTGQNQMCEDISEIKDAIANSKTDAAVQKTKIKPIFWIIGAVGLIVIDIIVRTIVK